MARIPKKLKKIPIVEALLEIRFTSSDLSELVIGKLASRGAWKDFASQRLPLAEMPPSLRERDPNLVQEPILQLQGRNGGRAVKIGPRVLSYHALAPYPGWSVLEPELSSCIEFLFETLPNLAPTRVGFRYLNVLTKEHLINSVADLNFTVGLAGAALTCPLNLNYERRRGENHKAIVRVASREFVQNPTDQLTAMVDVDISSINAEKAPVRADVDRWVSDAHNYLKEEFFALFPEPIIEQLEEK